MDVMIKRSRALKALAKMRKSLHKAWRKHDEILLVYARQRSELANALHREKHLLADLYRLKGVDFHEIEKVKLKIHDDNRLKRELEKQEKRVVHYMNMNSDLWHELSKLPGGLEQARRLAAAKA